MSIQLRLRRRPTVKATTLGRLTVDDIYVCDTLEDAIRETVPGGVPVSEWKKAGITAIPAGRYQLELVNSSNFGHDTLSLVGVPGFSLIRIHAGNDDSNTEGCILVGTAVEDPQGDGGDVVDSRIALLQLKSKILPRMKAGESAWIDVVNP
jgi:hypothetical protein